MKIPGKVPFVGFYYHYKHSDKSVNSYAYEVVGVGCHTEKNCRPEDTNVVIYRPLYPDPNAYKSGKLFYIRPLETFTEYVRQDGRRFLRFSKIIDEEIVAELTKIRNEMYL